MYAMHTCNCRICLELFPKTDNNYKCCHSSNRCKTKPHESEQKKTFFKYTFAPFYCNIHFSANGRPVSAMYRTPCNVELLKNSFVWYKRLVRKRRPVDICLDNFFELFVEADLFPDFINALFIMLHHFKHKLHLLILTTIVYARIEIFSMRTFSVTSLAPIGTFSH